MISDRAAQRLAIVIVAATGILVAAFAVGRALRRAEPHVEPDRNAYPVLGIDISAHNGSVCFDSIAAAGVDFVYLKASEGASFRDPAFRSNYDSARRAGLAVGAYHFFRFDCDGRRQAANILAAIDSCRLDLPVAIDIEEWGNPADIATDIVIGRLQTMEAMLRGAGRRVIFYTNKNGYSRFVRAAFPGNPAPELWICSFTDPPLAHNDWSLWQHSHLGRVPGVNNPVDLNTFNGSRARFRRWLSR
ncbi:MAG: hypothetical protein K2L16_01180 [Muribaculaceae bacterium]|nr:hypothetical protein [Muribaculaceae bacterium]